MRDVEANKGPVYSFGLGNLFFTQFLLGVSCIGISIEKGYAVETRYYL